MILYFSGTGNSEYVAKRIGQITGDEVLNLFDRLRSNDLSELHSETPWVVVCPTYAWQMPRIVRDWLEGALLTGSDRIAFVLTCGGSIAGAGAYAEKLAREKGMSCLGAAAVKMPENYIAMFNTPDREEALRIVDEAEAVIDQIGKTLRSGGMLDDAGGEKLQSALLNRAFYRFAIRDGKFTTNGKCTSCGHCTRMCPVENIALEDGIPVWSGRCIHCMACINLCPFQAIEYGTGTEKKERYRCPKTL